MPTTGTVADFYVFCPINIRLFSTLISENQFHETKIDVKKSLIFFGQNT